MRLLAIDPSITCTGWALFSIKSEHLIGVGKIKPLPPKHTLAERLSELNQQINQLFDQIKLSEKDVMICEAATSIKDPSAAFKVEQVRAAFETLARERQTAVPGRIHPRTVHYEVLGLTGKQLPRQEVKAMACNAAKTIYAKELKNLTFDCSDINLKKNQDIIDALLIGYISLSKIRAAKSIDMKLDAYFDNMSKHKKNSRRSLP